MSTVTAADLFSFKGGIGRGRFWALSGLTAFTLIPAYVAMLLTINRSNIVAFALVVFGIFTTCAAFAAFVSLGVRRLHDRGKTGMWAGLYYPALLIVATCEYDGNGRAIIAIALAIAAWALIDLGLLPGVDRKPTHQRPSP